MELYLFKIIAYGIAFVGGSCLFWLFHQKIYVFLKVQPKGTKPWENIFGGIAACICLDRYGGAGWGTALTAYVFFCLLAAIGLWDWHTMEIPNRCVILLFALALISMGTMGKVTAGERLAGMVCVSVPMLLTSLVSSGGFGGGDIKLMMAGGMFLGWKLTIASWAFAAGLGGCYVVYLLARGRVRRGACIAFGPFLCAGMALGLLYGNKFLEWYVGGGV